MTMIKRGSCSSDVVVSSCVYVCSSCEHTELKKDNSELNCPKCGSPMSRIAASAGPAEDMSEKND